MRHNRLRELLDAGQPTLGTRMLSTWPTMVELVGHSGMFDYVEFCGEYAPYDHAMLDNMGRAVELFEHLGGMIKIEQESRAHTAVRAIGAGFQSVLFADPRDVVEVEQCVRSIRTERPQSGGLHGVNMHRAAMHDAGSEAWADAMDKVVIALMIEKKEAIENLEAILAVPGVDMVQFGPADYSNSIGLTGQFAHPKVKEAEQYMITTAQKMGIAVRVELNDPLGFEPYLELGVKHFNVGIDVQTLSSWFCRSGAIMRRELGMEPLVKQSTSAYGS
ncbi:MAG: aldolase/citrate lyase family protein [Fuerstiella sp.]